MPDLAQQKNVDDAQEKKCIADRIDHDAFAETAGIAKPMDITIPANLWPAGLKPIAKKMGGQLPGTMITGPADRADVLIITYTTDETRALSHVMIDSRSFETLWYPYGHNFNAILPKITGGLKDNHGNPTTLAKGTLAHLLPVAIGQKTAMLCKSELHPARNGKQLPFIDLVQQLVSEVKPSLVITAGTGGAVGTKLLCGDVVVTETALFHCKHSYPDFPDIPKISDPAPQTPLSNSVNVKMTNVDYAIQNFCKLIASGLTTDIAKLEQGKFKIKFVAPNPSPQIYVKQVPTAQAMNVLSADYFSIDDSHDSEKLEEIGIMDDMDDAFVAYAVNKLPAGSRPKWLSIRNASEPQIPFMASLKDMKDQASAVYDTCGYHTSLSGGFACWAVVAGM